MRRLNPTFSSTRYCGTAATAVWTLGWVFAAAAAGLRLVASPDAGGVGAMIVTGAFAMFGCWWTARTLRWGLADSADGLPSAPESWPRRIVGWFVAVVWCFVAVVWNVGVIGWLICGAHQGRWWLLLVLIPWSLIGRFLLIVLFATGCTVIDSLGAALRRSVT